MMCRVSCPSPCFSPPGGSRRSSPATELPAPPAVLAALIAEARSGALFFHLGATLPACTGFHPGDVIGDCHRQPDRPGPACRSFADPWLILLLNLPALVVIVLAYIWAGLTEAAAIAAIAVNKLPNTAVTCARGRVRSTRARRNGAGVRDPALESVPACRVAATGALRRGRRAVRAFAGVEDRPGRSCSAVQTALVSRSAWRSSCSTSLLSWPTH